VRGGVAAERDQQVGGVARGDAGRRQARAQPQRAGRAGLAQAQQHCLHRVQPRDLVIRRERAGVGDVVGVAGEGVEGVHMRAQGAADQPGADREVFVAVVLARPGLDVVGCRAIGLPSGRA